MLCVIYLLTLIKIQQQAYIDYLDDARSASFEMLHERTKA